MKLTKIWVASTITISMGGLSACTTVDLSQVAVKETPEVSTQQDQNIVKRASYTLTSLFESKGWCNNNPSEKTQSATHVLLNGIQETSSNLKPALGGSSTTQLLADLDIADQQVKQTTKAAEVYLAMSDDLTALDTELSELETALLSASEAKTRFGHRLDMTSNQSAHIQYKQLSNSIDALKTVTDAYGARIRSQIAARADAKRS